MRFATSPDHLTFFYENHFIEFENLLSDEQVSLLLNNSFDVLEKRLSISSKELSKLSFEKRFKAGRDLWRENNQLKKMTLNSHFAEIAASLTKERQLRLSYSQFFSRSVPEKGDYPFPFLTDNSSLNECSSFQNIICGLILQLSDHSLPVHTQREDEDENDQKPLSILPERAGNGIFFLPNTPLSFEPFFTPPFCHQLLIVYSKEPSIYRFEKKDPNTHFLKKIGCGFGDRLEDSTHPNIFKN